MHYALFGITAGRRYAGRPCEIQRSILFCRHDFNEMKSNLEKLHDDITVSVTMEPLFKS